jgi:hypothetical protein
MKVKKKRTDGNEGRQKEIKEESDGGQSKEPKEQKQARKINTESYTANQLGT